MSENWKIQISYHLGQDMINVRAESADELAVLLNDMPVGDMLDARQRLNNPLDVSVREGAESEVPAHKRFSGAAPAQQSGSWATVQPMPVVTTPEAPQNPQTGAQAPQTGQPQQGQAHPAREACTVCGTTLQYRSGGGPGTDKKAWAAWKCPNWKRGGPDHTTNWLT
jgi:hypothetical protein